MKRFDPPYNGPIGSSARDNPGDYNIAPQFSGGGASTKGLSGPLFKQRALALALRRRGQQVPRGVAGY